MPVSDLLLVDGDSDDLVVIFSHREEVLAGRIERDAFQPFVRDLEGSVYLQLAIESQLEDPLGVIANGPQRLLPKGQREARWFGQSCRLVPNREPIQIGQAEVLHACIC